MLANSTRLAVAPRQQMVFEIYESGRVRQVETPAAKLLVGSAANCRLQINNSSVAPTHCLLMSGPRGTAFRAIAPVQFNGLPAHEGWLQTGDRLSLGDCDIVIVHIEPATVATQPKSHSDGRPDAAQSAGHNLSGRAENPAKTKKTPPQPIASGSGSR